MNLFSIAEWLASLDTSPIHVDAARCLHAIDRHSVCDQCIQTCPTNALSLNKSVVLNVEACVACGECLHDCPVGALIGPDKIPGLWKLATRPQNAHTLELACSAHPSSEVGPATTDAVLRFGGCLAALSPAAYVGLLALGFEQVTVRLDVCNICALGPARSAIERTVAMTRQLLAARQEDDRLVTIGDDHGQGWTCRPVYTKKSDLSRRDLFRRLAPTGQPPSGSAAQFFDAPVDEGQSANARRPSNERRRLLNALRRLPSGDGTELSSTRLDNLPFARIMADEKCIACGTCERICPTSALKLVESGDDHYQLTFNTGECINCGLCLKVCEPEALHREDPTLAELLESRPVTLQDGTLRQCSKCKAKFASASDSALCPTCEFRREHPFGSRIPPGLLKNRLATRRTVDAASQN